MTVPALFLQEFVQTLFDLLPIAAVLAVFQFTVVRRPFPNARRVLVGLAYVVLGLTLFRVGLTESLIPVGRDMARQLVQPAIADGTPHLRTAAPLFAFAAMIAFAATLIEPTLAAVAGRVQEMSGGAIRAYTLRVVVALGFAAGLFLGTARIVYGVPIEYLIAGMVGVMVVLVWVAPAAIIPLALDSGAVATSVVTVPLSAAYGVAIADAVPGQTAGDGFGLIALALLGSAISLLAFASIQAKLENRSNTGDDHAV